MPDRSAKFLFVRLSLGGALARLMTGAPRDHGEESQSDVTRIHLVSPRRRDAPAAVSFYDQVLEGGFHLLPGGLELRGGHPKE